ncbi:1-acyl-sn-glycerol-3-phosphate acyltransferase [Marmoricola endophyticus]|uniref:1-acyl-sn-glycerol-3-phosphate acyltransferase n=1 Tax=Marmoricola endophyticus TaxID=2040280 RepID=A0A917BHR9_9ACTN|nr:lysophospholipid acyltransferase family protein [Marmoricola endophyticus]GGF41684.1 1-acyl-sn-glycerol-3-phosphate acyltransferase [Marmoricola endophyticus]
MPSPLYALLHSVVPPVAKAVWRPEIVGLENVPRTGPLLLASNHLSFVDSVVIPIVVPRAVTFLAKGEYFTGTGVRGALSRTWFEGLGMQPIDRDDSRAAMTSLDTALGVLESGGAFGIYPEGTRSRDGRLYRGRTGVAHLALSAGARVVPVGLRGTDRIQPVGSRLPRLARIRVAFGEPIDPVGRYDDLPTGKARRLLTDEVMSAIATLSGQEEAGVYNDRAPDA